MSSPGVRCPFSISEIYMSLIAILIMWLFAVKVLEAPFFQNVSEVYHGGYSDQR